MQSEWKKVLACKATGWRSLGSPNYRCQDNIRMTNIGMALKEIGVSARKQINSVQDRDY